MKLPEYGYTPKNYKALVESTGLTNAQFCRKFDIHEQTFYKHMNGSRTMKWQDWKSLLQEVEKIFKLVVDLSAQVWYKVGKNGEVRKYSSIYRIDRIKTKYKP